ncbi:MAG: hypothetical protein Aurels2KO_44640 [Aureliella sp.]
MNSRDVPKFIPSTGVGFMRPLYDPLVRYLACQPQIHSHIVGQIDPLQCGSIADIGCGSGTLAIRMANLFPDATVHGIDIDDRMLAQAQAKSGSANVCWIQAPADKLPFDARSFDVVTCSLLLHHLTDHEKSESLKEVQRLLRSGGTLLLADYDLPASTFARLRFSIVRALDGWDRTRAHSLGQLPQLLRDAGFTDASETACIATPLGTVRCYRTISC